MSAGEAIEALNEKADLVEKAGKRFRAALEREKRKARYLQLKNQIHNGNRNIAYTPEYNKLFVEFGAMSVKFGESSSYHSEALLMYAKQAWRLALDLHGVTA